MSGLARTFLGWDAPALPRAASLLCENYRTSEALRLDDALVVVPGGRAGRRLKELLLEQADELDLPLVPPRVVTVGAVPELIMESVRPLIEPARSRMAWLETLRAASPERLETLFARLPATDAVRDWAGLAREVDTLHATAASAGLRFDDVAERCSDLPLFDDGERWAALAELQRDYEERIAALGLEDRHLARLRPLVLAADTPDDIWLLAVSDMPPVIHRMLMDVAAAGRRVRALVHAPESRSEAFDPLGCVATDAWLDSPVPVPEDRLEVVDRPEHQAACAAAAMAGLGGAYAAEEVAVAVPDAGVVPYLEQRLEDAGVPARNAAGDRLDRTPPYRLLAAIADWLDGRRFEALAALARHPDLHASLGPRDPLPALDAYFKDHLPAQANGAFRGLGGRAEHRDRTEAVRAAVDALVKPLEEPGPGRLSQGVTAALELLAGVYGDRDLRPDRPTDRRLLQSLDRLKRAGDGFRDLPPSLDPRCTPATAIRMVLDEAAGDAIPPDPDRGAVELLGWLEMHLDDAPVAVVTGLNEPFLPGSVTAHAFLPNSLRSHLGLLDNDRRYARDAYQLTAILHARQEVFLISGRRSATGDPLRPSRLLLAADPETVARRVRRFYAEEAGEGEGGGDAGRVLAGANAGDAGDARELVVTADTDDADRRRPASGFVLPPEPVIELDHPIVRLRATDFSRVLADPYGFALERALKLEPVDDAARELDGLGFGWLAHRVLEGFGRREKPLGRPGVADVDETDASAVAAYLDCLLDQAFDGRYGDSAHVAARVQREQLRARLHRFAVWHAGWIADGWQMRAVECSTPDEGLPMMVDGRPMNVTARIDRVDYHPGLDEWAVFDYKTSDRGEGPEKTHRKGGKDREWVDLQLPVYHWLLPQLKDDDGPIAASARPDRIRLGYILLPRDLECVGHEIADWSGADIEEAMDVARDVVRKVREGRFEFDPDARARWPDPRMEALLGRGQLTAADDESDAGEAA